MNRKKLFRNIGIIAFIVLLFVGLSFFGGNNSVDYQSVNTSTILQQIKDDNVEKAVVEDREQVLKVILKKKTKDYSDPHPNRVTRGTRNTSKRKLSPPSIRLLLPTTSSASCRNPK